MVKFRLLVVLCVVALILVLWWWHWWIGFGCGLMMVVALWYSAIQVPISLCHKFCGVENYWCDRCYCVKYRYDCSCVLVRVALVSLEKKHYCASWLRYMKEFDFRSYICRIQVSKSLWNSSYALSRLQYAFATQSDSFLGLSTCEVVQGHDL